MKLFAKKTRFFLLFTLLCTVLSSLVSCVSAEQERQEAERRARESKAEKEQLIRDYPFAPHQEVIQSSFDKDYLFEAARSWLVTNYSNAANSLNAVIDKSMLSLQVSIPLSHHREGSYRQYGKTWTYNDDYKGQCVFTILVEFRESRMRVSTTDVKAWCSEDKSNVTGTIDYHIDEIMTDTGVSNLHYDWEAYIPPVLRYLRKPASEKYQAQWQIISSAMHKIAEGSGGLSDW